MDLAYLLDLIRQYGDAAYTFIFTYAATNSMLMPLFVGYAASQKVFDWGTAILVCWAGAFLGDTVRFWLGRKFGVRMLDFFPRIQRGADVIVRLIEKHHAWMLIVYRYPHGLRGLAGFVFGIARLPWPRFVLLNFVSAGIWAVSLISVGYSFGHVSEKALGDAASGLSATLLLVFLALAWVLSKRLDRVIEQNS